MKKILFIFFLIVQLSLHGQSTLPLFTSPKNDTVTFMRYLPVKADFILAYSEECYCRSNIESFKLLVRSGNVWTTWVYYKKWKSSVELYNNAGKKSSKLFRKQATIDSASVKELFDSLKYVNFWTLSTDSLCHTKDSDISDIVNYKFQLETHKVSQTLECYELGYCSEKDPANEQCFLFLQSTEIFGRWWKRYAANEVFHKTILKQDDVDFTSQR